MTTGSALHLHEDDLDARVEGPDGQPITNLTADEYAATWAQGTPHVEVPDNMAELMAQIAGERAVQPRLLTSPLKWMPAYSHGGKYGAGTPLGVAVHSTEGPNGPGAAEAVAGPGWFGGSKAGTSAHKIVDQNSICEGVRRDTVAWALGAGGNGLYISYEFSGYASWDAATWRQPAQLSMLQIAAQHIADDLKAIGAPARWLSVAQAAARQKGLLTHNDVRLAFPGTTTHSDPGAHFPYAELLGYVLSYMAPAPAPKPVPKPAPARPPVAAWKLPAGQWLGNVAGGSEQHGGDLRYDSAAVHAMVQTVQRYLILRGCVAGQSNPMSGWADGVWGAPTDVAMTVWHQRFYPGQPKPAQCWADDYRRLTA
jgi:hypothetical protein